MDVLSFAAHPDLYRFILQPILMKDLFVVITRITGASALYAVLLGYSLMAGRHGISTRKTAMQRPEIKGIIWLPHDYLTPMLKQGKPDSNTKQAIAPQTSTRGE